MVTITLNGTERYVEDGITVLEAARREGVDIPTLCYHEALAPYGACRLCMVEAEGPRMRRVLLPSCNLKVFEGLVIDTETWLVRDTRTTIMELLLATTPNTELLLILSRRLGVEKTRYQTNKVDKCILCGLCVRVCREKIGASALNFKASDENDNVVADAVSLSSDACIGCGSCANICPIGVIHVADGGDERVISLYGEQVNTLRLVRCESCGKPYTTQKFLDFVLSRLEKGVSSKSKLRICENCAGEYYSVALTGQFLVFEEFPPIL
ncbi:MAG: 2Fe-2S iron-sulfur cluster-binding protein [Dissulfurispiraceae bacterium]